MHASGKPSEGPQETAASTGTWFRHARGSASVLGLLVLCAAPTFAAQAANSQQRPANRPGMEAVHSVVLQLSKALAKQDARGLMRLFSRNAEVRTGSQALADGPTALLKALRQPPLSETTPFHVVQKSGRILAPGLAIVYGELVQYGSVILRRALPVQLVLSKTDSGWRIVSLWLPSLSQFLPAPAPH